MQPEPGQASISRAGSGGTVKKETVRKRGWWCEQRKEIGVCESNFFLKTTSNLKKKKPISRNYQQIKCGQKIMKGDFGNKRGTR